MHTEHLQNVRPGLVGMAWIAGVSISAMLLVAAIAFHLIDPDSAMGARAAIVAIAAGHFTGGMYAGLRAKTAPILHGVFIGLVSLIAWFVVNLVAALVDPNFGWSALTPNLAIALVLLMIVSAVLGARAGYRKTL